MSALRAGLRVASVIIVALALIVVAAGAPRTGPESANAATAAKKKRKLRPVCRRHERPSGRRHCVRAPRNAVRPRKHRQQGGPNNLVPLPTTGGLGAGGNGFDREESAIAWAQGLRHDTHYAWYCERFVENAFNASDKFNTAWQAAQRLGLHHGKPPRGALVFFRPDKTNQYLGHVGIALNRSSMISALNSVEVSDLEQEYWANRYAGWTYAPDDWSGRLIVPAPPDPNLDPSGTQPTPSGPSASVQLQSPSADETISGTATLRAHIENASGVEFDAYYASDPANPNTLSWHKLGNGNPTGSGNWAMPYDTHAIPDQGNPAWGTVNFMAIALDAAGDPMTARDYRRANVANSAPAPPPPPPPPAYYVHHVFGTCADGLCGVNVRSGPGYTSYPKVGGLYDGWEADIVCQTLGETVSGGPGTSSVWDRLTSGGYVTDVYIDTPSNGFSPPIPQC